MFITPQLCKLFAKGFTFADMKGDPSANIDAAAVMTVILLDR